MRFDAGFLVALAALSHLPAGSGRVLYGYGPSARDLVDQPDNATFVERAVIVPPPKPITPKPVPGPDPIVPGGDKTPGTPGENTPADPVPLVPGDKTPTTPADPAPLVPGDKNPTTPGDKVVEDPPTAGNKDIDLWCPSDALADLAKRSLEGRAPGRSCGRNRDPADMRPAATRNADYDRRGARARSLVRDRPYDDIDYPTRINTNYRMGRTEDADYGASSWEDIAPQTRDSGYDVSTSPSDWDTWDTFSPGVEEPVTRVSYSRRRRDRELDDDHSFVVAHDRFSNRDSNRWQMDERGSARTRRNPVNDEDEYIPADDWEDRSAPASQLVYEGGRRSRAFGPLDDSPVTPRRYTFFSEGLSGRETRATVDESFEAMGQTGRGRMRLRRDTEDELERLHYDRLSGLDNTYSYTNTAVRNRDFADYSPTTMDVWEGPNYLIANNWERPARRWD